MREEIRLEENTKNVNIPDQLSILAIRGGVVFPGIITPLIISTSRASKLIDDALVGNKMVCAVSQKKQDIEEAGPEDLHQIGTVAHILKMLRFPDWSIRILLQGIKRARVNTYLQIEPYLKAEITTITESDTKDVSSEAIMRNVLNMFQKLSDLAQYLPDELNTVILNIESPSRLADFIAHYLNITLEEKQKLLEMIDPITRLSELVPLLNKEISILELSAKIRDKVKGELDKNQRDYVLREQLKAIQKELGETDDLTAEINELKAKIDKAKMPEKVLEVTNKEISRLSRMSPQAAEYTVVRTYLDWLVHLPWSVASEDNLDIKRVKQILDQDHYNLTKVKERILEYLSVKKLRKDSKGPILCFVGPPGVGKTSLGRSIARAMGRKFIRFSLGGIRDEAEIRGHRRTYVGALPGRIIQGIRNAGTNNPLFMLDEIDKVGSDFRGDPSSALLEVLDPEQNFSFSDHYLEVPFDLSKVMFITTANMTDTIIPALKDRMEIIELPGYIDEEKMLIAKNFLIERQLKEAGLTSKHIQFSDKSILKIISDYTREAGVRNLEREIGSIIRKIARKYAEGNNKKKVLVSDKSVSKYLGPQKYFSEVAARQGTIGVSTGLAVTPFGGEILFIEATKMKGQKGLLLTGSLGDVMKESAQAALSFIRSNGKLFEIDEDFFTNSDVHIHIPAGATPKDGPSAGVALSVALLSLLKNKSVDPHIAMTGEITLTGRVLPVGGIKEKIIAANRAGIKTVLLPLENKKDLVEIPDKVKKRLVFKYVKTIKDVYAVLFNLKKKKK
ncbi:MAG: endopeptidase La [Candidatus Latescibacteria bacterium]|nr:endopeptidase La [Candidatus Latescibacterota bacterium]